MLAFSRGRKPFFLIPGFVLQQKSYYKDGISAAAALLPHTMPSKQEKFLSSASSSPRCSMEAINTKEGFTRTDSHPSIITALVQIMALEFGINILPWKRIKSSTFQLFFLTLKPAEDEDPGKQPPATVLGVELRRHH